jgi:F0F1-type ATP synthase delta subunit
MPTPSGGRGARLASDAVTEVVDRAMLGGLVVESGSIVLGGSREGQLERMRRRLASG